MIMNGIRRYEAIAMFVAITVVALLLFSGTTYALDPGALPTGGRITSGKGSIATTGNQMTIKQSSKKMIADWDTFNIGTQAGVAFRQPNSKSVALNRIYDQNPSQILGSLTANGRIYLINPAGIVFGEGSQVNVGGLVASSLNIADQDFLKGKYIFTNDGNAGNVINQGNISVIPGGVVALIGPSVSNEGTITATKGDVVLAAGDQVTLNLNRNGLISYTVDKGAIDALAANSGLIKADGGLVVMTAKAADSLTSAVVNNSGVIEAQTLKKKSGRIMLMSDMENGQTIVDGTLDASAPSRGDGGFIETSAASVKVSDTAIITTFAPKGKSGTWLIDPKDFVIASSGGDMTGTELSNSLDLGNVTIFSTSGSNGINGDILVKDNITWTKNTLTLNAYRNIEINRELFGSGTARLYLYYGQGSTDGVIGGTTSDYYVNAPINLAEGDGKFSTRLGSSGTTISYYVITNLGTARSRTGTDLQGMRGNLTRNYALGGTIDASGTSGWNRGSGFTPVGTSADNFTGKFDGLGHTISDLTINRGITDYVGLFGYIGSGGAVSNVGMVGGSITGNNYVGGLLGYAPQDSNVRIKNSYNTGSVIGTGNYIGGLVGRTYGSITNSYATGNVTGSGDETGGLVGRLSSNGSITDSYATGTVNGGNYTGGLVGRSWGDITNSYATGNVTGTGNYTGGLLGSNEYFNTTIIGDITNSYAAGNVIGYGSYIGGLVGQNGNTDPAVSGNVANITDAYATGSVTGSGTSQYIGGLVGNNIAGSTISNAYATGSVSGSSNVGGFAGYNNGTISNSYWDTITSGRSTGIGGGTITGATGLTTAQMMDSANFSGWDFTNTWWMSYGNTRPFLCSEWSTTIINSHQLQLMAMDLTKSYTLGADISMDELSNASGLWNTSTGFVPVGNPTTPFIGTFDGQDHTITNLAINRPDENYVGLFGYSGSGATVSNVGLEDSNVQGNNNVGQLIGLNFGTITKAYTTGSSTTGNWEVGGLVGFNAGDITQSYATGSVSGTNDVGGLAGGNYGSIANTYAWADVTGSSGAYYISALVGYIAGPGTVSYSYATGAVDGGYQDVGGLIGGSRGSTTSSFWDTETTGQVVSSGGTGKTTAEMMTLTTFTDAGWDTTNIWNVASYPTLK